MRGLSSPDIPEADCAVCRSCDEALWIDWIPSKLVNSSRVAFEFGRLVEFGSLGCPDALEYANVLEEVSE